MSYRFRRAFLFLVVGACGGEPEPVVTQRAAPIDTPGAASVAFTRGRGAESILLSTRPGAGIAEYTLDNSWHTSWQAITEITGFKWKGPKLVSSGDYRAVAATYDAGADRLSVLARRGDELVELAREGDRWTDPLTIATGVAGTPSILEGSHDGNLEAVTPLAAGGLMHLFRSSRDRAWSETSRFGSGPVDAVTMVQDAASAHLDVIALVGAELAHYWRDDLGTWEWHGPSPVATGIAGAPSVVRVGSGDYELVAPSSRGGFVHLTRPDRSPDHAWRVNGVVGDSALFATSLLVQDDRTLEAVEAREDGLLVHATRIGEAQLEEYVFGSEAVCDPARGGAWADPLEGEIVGIHSAVMPTGKVLLFGDALEDVEQPESRVFDPIGGTVTQPSVREATLSQVFCGGQTFLPDGRLFVAGGMFGGVQDLHLFDGPSETWSLAGRMAVGRWYPTVTALPGGRSFVIGGSVDGPDTPINDTYEFFDPAVGPGIQRPLPKPFGPNDPGIGLYPFVQLLPDGRLLIHASRTTRFFDPETGQWEPTILEPYLPQSRVYPAQGAFVMLPLRAEDAYRPVMMLFGGAGPGPPNIDTPSTNTVERLDLRSPDPSWKLAPSMSFARSMADAVTLPDGSVLVVSGAAMGAPSFAADPVLFPERYDPTTDSFETMCPMRVPRLYHATAVLLPDARVLVAGTDGWFNNGPYQVPETRLEIYSPPYLARGPRPVLTSAPEKIAYGSAFEASVGGVPASAIESAVLIRPGATTHSNDMSQRSIRLAIEADETDAHDEGRLTLLAPPNANVAPEGTYMLFVTAGGVPSIARFVALETRED